MRLIPVKYYFPAYGLGSAGVRTNKDQVGAAPTVTAANDGLSLSGTTVQLGQDVGAVGDPAILINDREIPMGGFSFIMQQAGSRLLVIDPTPGSAFYSIGDIDAIGQLGYLRFQDTASGEASGVLNASRSISIGDVENINGGLSFGTAGNFGGQERFTVSKQGNEYIGLYLWDDQYAFGDINNNTNGGSLQINNGGLIIELGFTDAATNNSLLTISDAGENFAFSSVSGGGLIIDNLMGSYFLGKSGGGNSTNLLIDDAAQTATISSGGGSQYFTTDFAGFFLDIFFDDGVDSAGLTVDASGRTVQMFSNAAFLNLNGAADQLDLQTANGLKITGDTVMIHSGTSYANGAAAQVGTLTNAPAAGDPTKWIPVDDNGTTRYIPAW